MFTFVPSHPCFFSVFRLVYRAYLFGVLYSWSFQKWWGFSLAFQKIQLPCINLQTSQRLLLWRSRKVSFHATANRMLLMLLWCLSRAPLWHACCERILLIQGLSADRLPLGPGDLIFSLFSAQSAKLLCSITKMFKQIFSAVCHFVPLAYSFYSCPDRVWLVTHLASK